MKAYVLGLVASMVILVGAIGCVPTDEEMVNLHNSVDTLMGQIDETQVKVSKEIDRIQSHVKTINDATKTVEGLPQKAAAGIEASRPFNPYADEMAAVLGLATVVGGLFARSKVKELNTVKAKRKAESVGRERTLRELAANGTTLTAPMVKDLMFRNIGDARASAGV
jgi:hypothetical protein